MYRNFALVWSILACASSWAQFPTTTKTVADIYGLEALFVENQHQWLPVAPPSQEVFLQPGTTVVPVDWTQFPKPFIKKMYAEMDKNGLPLYKISIYEDPETREKVFLNSFGEVAYTLKPEKNYDPYTWQMDYFNLESTYVLDDFQRWLYDPAHVALQFTLIPESLHEDYVLAESVSEPMMMAMESGPPSPPAGTNSNTNVVITATNHFQMVLTYSLPTNFGSHAEIFTKENLQSPSWQVALNRTSVTGGTEFTWVDATSSNIPARFYILSDADDDEDHDGYSSGREHYVTGTNPDEFNEFDVDVDHMQDWFEVMNFGGSITNQSGSDDFDLDGLSNTNEMFLHPAEGTNAAYVSFYSDPTLFDTDNGGIDDGFEKTNGYVVLDAFNPADDVADFDSDGLSNLTEYQLGTALGNVDTDGDGVTDGVEVDWNGYTDTNGVPVDPVVFNTWNWNSDDDGDGLTLIKEYEYGTDPGDPSDGAQTNSVVDVALTLGNHSSNYGYGYTLKLSGPIIIQLESEPDAVATKTVKLQKGKSYAFSLTRKENQSACGAPSKACTVLISGKDLAFNDPNEIRGVHPDDDSMDEIFENGTATGMVHVVKVEVEDCSLTATPSTSAEPGTDENGNDCLVIRGYCDWDCTLKVSPLAAKKQVDVRWVQTVKGTVQKVFRNPAGGNTGKQVGTGGAWMHDGVREKSIWIDTEDTYILISDDEPTLPADFSTYSAAHMSYQFEDFIQYKVGTGAWTTLQKGVWTASGSGSATPDGQGGYTPSGAVECEVVAPFAPSTATPVDPPPVFNDILQNDSQWEVY